VGLCRAFLPQRHSPAAAVALITTLPVYPALALDVFHGRTHWVYTRTFVTRRKNGVSPHGFSSPCAHLNAAALRAAWDGAYASGHAFSLQPPHQPYGATPQFSTPTPSAASRTAFVNSAVRIAHHPSPPAGSHLPDLLLDYSWFAYMPLRLKPVRIRVQTRSSCCMHGRNAAPAAMGLIWAILFMVVWAHRQAL